jgi:hypothetical protein
MLFKHSIIISITYNMYIIIDKFNYLINRSIPVCKGLYESPAFPIVIYIVASFSGTGAIMDTKRGPGRYISASIPISYTSARR